jgi:putative transposase
MSSYYYKPRPSCPDKVRCEAQLKQRIYEICAEFQRYGYRRVTAQLKSEGWPVNHRRVARIMREEDLCVRPKRRFVRTAGSDHDGPIFPDRAKDIDPWRLGLLTSPVSGS